MQQKAVESRGAYLAITAKLDALKTPVPEDGLAARAGGYLRKAFDFAIRAPVLLYNQDLAQLSLQRDQSILDRFITDTVSHLAGEIAPAVKEAAPAEAARIEALEKALDSGVKARSAAGVAAISCAQASGSLQWANNKYYFNALQRSQNSERDLRQAETALGAFNAALEAADIKGSHFDNVADVTFSKFGPEYSRSNSEKFTDARVRLEAQTGSLTAQIDRVKAELLDSLHAAAGTLGIRTKAFESLITAAHQRIKPPQAALGGAPPKADF
ncbi:MAG: hypothetical protein Q8K65_05480 [Alphaproteobacteria bacterium]|nr:hypothetical protein [Alphaproteobacteria bacterium]